jgi:glycosyltransferase involved in cell wall biosynthesis
LYRRALAVIVPSRAEGFSLPVVEAMASGVPAVVSAIAAHGELVAAPDLCFPPDDPEAFALALARLADRPAYRARVVAVQDQIWLRFTAVPVAARFWGAIAARASAERAACGAAAAPMKRRAPRRPRLAALSPLPPDRSGCADYTAACCAALAERAEVHLFTETSDPAPVAGATRIGPLSALPAVDPRYDRVIAVLGNSEYHATIYRLLLRFGGAAILHDAWLLPFHRAMLGLEETLRVAAAELGRDVTDEDIAGWLGPNPAGQPMMLGDVVRAAVPLCVHSAATARLIRNRYGISPVSLPFAQYRPWSEQALGVSERVAARARLGLPGDVLVVACFGFVQSSKRPAAAIEALARLRATGATAILLFVGAWHRDRAALAIVGTPAAMQSISPPDKAPMPCSRSCKPISVASR